MLTVQATLLSKVENKRGVETTKAKATHHEAKAKILALRPLWP